MEIEELKRRVKNEIGLSDDEIRVTFKTDEDLETFYREYNQSGKLGVLDENNEAKDDDYDLPEKEKKFYDRDRKEKADAARHKEGLKKEFDNIDQSGMPDVERMSFEDFAEGL